MTTAPMTAIRPVRVLVTGASGALGARLATALWTRGHMVCALVQRANRAEWLYRHGLTVAVGDVGTTATLERALNDMDVVVHLAGYRWSPLTRRRERWRVDVAATAAMVRAAAYAGVTRVIVGSSVSAVAHPGAAANHHRDAVSVIEPPRERTAREIAARYSLAFTAARLGAVYGPGDRAHLPVFQAVAAGLAIPVHSDRVWVRPVFLYDVVHELCARVEAPESFGDVWALEGRDMVTPLEFVEAIAAAIAVPARVRCLPRWLSWLADAAYPVAARIPSGLVQLGARAATTLQRMPTARRHPSGAPFSVSGRTSLHDGLRETVAWYLHQRWVVAGAGNGDRPA